MNSNTIYKYEYMGQLGDVWTLEANGLKKIVHFGIDYRGYNCVWAEIDLDDTWTYKIDLLVVGTGFTFDTHGKLKHVNSVITDGGLVWHCYAGKPLL